MSRNADPERLEKLAALLPRAAHASLDRLASRARDLEFGRRERLASQDACELFAILTGYVGGWRADADGHEHLVALTGPGELANLLALGSPPMGLDLRALTNGTAAAWPASLVASLANEDGGLAASLLDRTLEASGRLLTRLEHVSFDPVPRRLARLLWQRREVLFDERRPLLSRVELANLVGATREMTDRVIRQLEADGVIERVPPTGLVLRDPHALAALAEVDQDDRACS